MIDCLVIGDSIAVGVSNARPECVSYSKGGWNTWQWNRDYLNKDLTASTVIISLGSNDHKYINTRKELEKMREKVKGSRVFWILPHGNLKASEVPIENIQAIVRDVASKYGDVVLPIQSVQSDKIHPSWAGYKQLAKETK
jgi:hypothetical protein